MRVVILGVTTGLGARLAESLLGRGMTPVGLVRSAEHTEALKEAGVEPVVLDTHSAELRSTVVRALTGADAVVLAAGTGTGPGSLGAATATASPAALLSGAAERVGVRRFVLVSALLPSAADRAALGNDLPAYLREKANAEQALAERDLDWTVLRPGTLRDAAPTGRILLRSGADPGPEGEIGRADLATTITYTLTAPRTVHRTLAVSTGSCEISTALAGIGT
ncbi:NAD(P)H-binding protein [Streptomyces minutiscleroticus]|uniref:NAD-dependent dehydratase n=1 Tax=Streptomyces minutiscleroticus TaxID=68238 RepID=A0A918U7R0_9ACTN|nr:NAD(P)H-binding protein [Streptomyces minutiscleroticus]GGY04303.1 NAD-dependent dehydratase [Streptomyces minutiscleroticus]